MAFPPPALRLPACPLPASCERRQAGMVPNRTRARRVPRASGDRFPTHTHAAPSPVPGKSISFMALRPEQLLRNAHGKHCGRFPQELLASRPLPTSGSPQELPHSFPEFSSTVVPIRLPPEKKSPHFFVFCPVQAYAV